MKNKKHIRASLELFVEGEMLDGENKYLCEQCNAKVTTLKRCCIKHLPRILILHLKRFEVSLAPRPPARPPAALLISSGSSTTTSCAT